MVLLNTLETPLYIKAKYRVKGIGYNGVLGMLN